MITYQSPSAAISSSHERADLELRLRSEFAEMPGMRLTIPQAARLFNLDPAQCEGVLRQLVRNGVLSSDGRGFARAGSGREWH
jgi:hypothetical protein